MTTPKPSIVIAERGAPWAVWAERFRRHGPDVTVLLQDKGEPIQRFGARVRARLSEGGAPARVVVVGGGRTDRDALSSRSVTIRALTSRMAEAGGGSLFLDDAGTDRLWMQAFAQTAAALVRGTGVSVRHAGTLPALAA